MEALLSATFWGTRKRGANTESGNAEAREKDKGSSTDNQDLILNSEAQKKKAKQAGLPQNYTKDHVASMLGCVLEQVIALNPSQVDVPILSSFTSTALPGISIANYMLRLSALLDNDSTLVLAVYHLRTILRNRPGVYITPLNIHRLALASILTAVKVHEDKIYRNALFAKIGGIANPELNRLEVEFLSLISYNLFVPPEDYEAFFADVISAELHANCKCAQGLAVQRLAQTFVSSSPLQRPLSSSSDIPSSPRIRPMNSTSTTSSASSGSFSSSSTCARFYMRHFSTNSPLTTALDESPTSSPPDSARSHSSSSGGGDMTTAQHVLPQITAHLRGRTGSIFSHSLAPVLV